MGTVKQQHYVPRCYLRNFADGRGQIWVYDKLEDRFFPTNIENIASEKYFYDSPELEKAVGQPQFVEKSLSILEGQAAGVIQTLLKKMNNNNFTRLHPEERQHLALFMAVQTSRTRRERIRMKKSLEKLSMGIHRRLTDEMKTACPENVPPLEFSEELLKEMQGNLLTDPEIVMKNAGILECHFWLILKACPGHRFLTSDNPFTRKAHVGFPFGGLGIASKGIEINFPLSPDYCLSLFGRTHFDQKNSQFRHMENKVCQSKDPANMEYCNQFQVSQSARFAFGKEKDDLVFAQKMCIEYPQLRRYV